MNSNATTESHCTTSECLPEGRGSGKGFSDNRGSGSVFKRSRRALTKSHVAGDNSSSLESSSPAVCIGCEKHPKIGDPDPDHISTSFVERQNLTMRMQMRRFTRLTNAFSKKVENHVASIAIHYMNYNFCRIHQTLRITPAMAAGVSNHVWDIADIVNLIDETPQKPMDREDAQYGRALRFPAMEHGDDRL